MEVAKLRELQEKASDRLVKLIRLERVLKGKIG